MNAKIHITLKNVLLLMLILTGAISWSQGKTPQSGYMVFTVGSVEVIALSDGTVPVSANDLLTDKKQGSIKLSLDEAFLSDPVEVSINAYLIKTKNNLILVDTGSGELFGTYGGHLTASLKEAGFSPNDITDILITHIHVDHSGGLSAHNTIQFPNATVHVNKKEVDFWLSRSGPKKDEDKGVTANRPAFLALKPYLDAGKVKTFEGNVALFPEVKTVEFTGHTAGHTLFVLESKDQKLVFWGDLIHIAAVQLHHPDFLNEFDFDKEKAAAQRAKVYQIAAKEEYLIAADHISFPGVGRIRAVGSGYVWVPVPYSVLGRNR